MRYGTEYAKFPDIDNQGEPVILDAIRLKDRKNNWALYQPLKAFARPFKPESSDEVIKNGRSIISTVSPFLKKWHKKTVASELRKEWFEKLCATSAPALLYYADLCEHFTVPEYSNIAGHSDLEFVAHPFMHPFIPNVKLYVIFVNGNTVWDYVIMV
jgi:hypothetical protein